MRLYMHTIDGRPGYFDGHQIVLAEMHDQWRDDYPLCVVVKSERQIRSERQRSEKYRLKHKFDVPVYDFVILSDKPDIITWRR